MLERFALELSRGAAAVLLALFPWRPDYWRLLPSYHKVSSTTNISVDILLDGSWFQCHVVPYISLPSYLLLFFKHFSLHDISYTSIVRMAYRRSLSNALAHKGIWKKLKKASVLPVVLKYSQKTPCDDIRILSFSQWLLSTLQILFIFSRISGQSPIESQVCLNLVLQLEQTCSLNEHIF